MKIFAILLCVLASITSLFSQEETKANYTYRFEAMQGKIRENFDGLPPYSNSQYIEFGIHKHANQNNEWHNYYFFPEIGASFIYGSLGNDSILGSVFSVYPSWYFNILRGKRFGLTIKTGVGFAYFNSPFDLQSNSKNLFVGSNITNITSIGLNLRTRITKSLHVTAGVSFVHFSNGHIRIPNVGINDNRLVLGLQYTPVQTNYIRTKPTTNENYPIRLNVRGGIGFHESGGVIRPIGGQVYPIYNFALYASKQKNLHDFYAGIYTMYYQGFYNFIQHEDLYPGKEAIHSMVVSSFVGHEFLFGHFSFVQEIAGKIYNPLYNDLAPFQPEYVVGKTTPKSILSFRLGFFYYWLDYAKNQKNNLATGIFIKTNLEQADFVELNLSYCL